MRKIRMNFPVRDTGLPPNSINRWNFYRIFGLEGMGKALPGMLLHIRGWQENRCLYVSGGGLSGPCGYSDWYKSEIDL